MSIGRFAANADAVVGELRVWHDPINLGHMTVETPFNRINGARNPADVFGEVTSASRRELKLVRLGRGLRVAGEAPALIEGGRCLGIAVRVVTIHATQSAPALSVATAPCH